MIYRQLDGQELEQGLAAILQSPKEEGLVKMIVRRPAVNEREIMRRAELDGEQGLIGDRWTLSDQADLAMQLTLMNARVAALVAVEEKRWPLAGDQFYVDMDLSGDNLPAGTRLALGSAVIEVTAEPHTGCKKFATRFGQDAMVFVNSRRGKSLNLRGINARVVQAGVVYVGDRIQKLPG